MNFIPYPLVINENSTHTELEKELEAAIGILKLKHVTLKPPSFSEKIKKTPFQVKVLRKLFKITQFPSTATRKDLSILLSIPQRNIQVWFQNMRQARKRHWNSPTRNNKNHDITCDNSNEDVSICKLIEIIDVVKRGS
ncbi:hypothetical protein PAEPH01_0300 [Pancytospora epiphaga]|nr:hypothetical protein PAEPH01_0300 [Pancytospora epiphaga]